MDTLRAPRGIFPMAAPWPRNSYFKATGEYRNPKKGEFFLSGAVIETYRAPHDISQPFWIAEGVTMVVCPHCEGRGKVEKKWIDT